MEKLKYKDIAVMFLDSKKHITKASTYAAYHNIIFNHLIPFFGEYEELTNELMQKFVMKYFESGYSRRMVRDFIVLNDGLLKFGNEKELVAHKKFDIVYPTSFTYKKSDKNLNVEQTNKLRKELLQTSENNIYHFAILIALSTGLRVGEVCGLKWSDIDFENNILTVNRTVGRIQNILDDNTIKGTRLYIRTPKTKSSRRRVPIAKDIVAFLTKKFTENANTESFVLNRVRNKNEPLEARLLREHYIKLLKKLNIPFIKFHALRHGFASHCMASKIDVKTTASLLGHADVRMTLDIYTHSSFEQKKSAVMALEKSFK